MYQITVIKRNGDKELFSPEKISKVVHAAGLTEKQADELARKVSGWISSSGLQSVTSIQIRDQIITGLKNIDQHVADLYRWYEQTKSP